jgi:beta-galactosidase
MEDGRKPDEKDIRHWSLVSMAGGVKGILFLRWRPLLDGPLFGAFGPFGMDGAGTPRSDMASKVGKWANGNPEIWKSNPVKGDIGIVFAPESERFNFAQQGSTANYAESARGAYMAFFDAGLQPDWVHIDHIAEYPVIYLPYPVALKDETVRKLEQYVMNGGYLVSEGLPGYFDHTGHAYPTQPNRGLEKVFGARETDVEFTPDLEGRYDSRSEFGVMPGRFFRQSYEATTGRARSQYSDGKTAAVENTYGKGRTMLMGSFTGAAYFRKPNQTVRDLYARIPEWARQTLKLTVSDRSVQARLHTGAGGTYLWVLNPNREAKTVTVTVMGAQFQSAKRLWGAGEAAVSGKAVQVAVEDRDGAVLKLE